ncbi:MAG: hypothetical protein R3301_18670 [Saprospiraceae bacterium]|nr:hypothetical protein [Saprospiraceae bacterium]
MSLRKFFFCIALIIPGFSAIQAQEGFPENYAGVWKGTLYVFANSALENQVPMQLTISPGPDQNIWSWKLEYQSPDNPVVKDYRLLAKSKEMGLFALDEGNGVMIDATYYNPRLYSVFEANSILLTSIYTMTPNEIVFEVTAGQKADVGQEVTSHPIASLQRAVLTRAQ